MDELLAVIADVGLELHPDRIDVIADRLGKISSVEQFAAVKSSFGPNIDKRLASIFHRAGLGRCDGLSITVLV